MHIINMAKKMVNNIYGFEPLLFVFLRRIYFDRNGVILSMSNMFHVKTY